MRHLAGVVGWIAVMAALAGGGCATVPPVEAEGLALRKVVIYRNGIGYFERAGRVDSTEVRFRVRKNEVSDFLASLAVLERGGSSVRSASFPLDVEEDPPAPPPPPDQPRPLAAPSKPGEGTPGARTSDLKTVVMALDGKEHDLQVGYIAATPIWRPSYRLVLGEAGATLQVWGIVQNLSGEDWRSVSLSLIAEAPLAFETGLATAVIPPRPSVNDNGDVIAVVPRSDTSLAQSEEVQAAAPAAPPPPAAAPGPREEMADLRSMLSNPAKKAKRGVADDEITVAARAVSYSGRSRNLSALAAVALQAGATRYDLPAPVTIPDKSATMVMLLDRPIPGEALALFAPEDGVPDSASHPFRVARFTNKTGGLLERGPLAIFQEGGGRGAFLGQGTTDALPDGATATVPFALERTIAVDRSGESREEGARLYKIEAGTLTIARDTVALTKYRLRNGAGHASKLLVRHPRIGGARLVRPPAGTEDNVGSGTALVPAALAAHATQDLVVDERQQTVRNVDWLDPLADDAVTAFIALGDKPGGDPAAARALAAAWTFRKALLASTDERRKLGAMEADLRRATDESRNNIKALEKNKAAGDLRAKLTDRLAADSTRLDEVTKRIIEVDLAVNEQRVRFLETVRGIKVLRPAPTVD